MWPKYQRSHQTETHYPFHRVVCSYHIYIFWGNPPSPTQFSHSHRRHENVTFFVDKLLAMADSSCHFMKYHGWGRRGVWHGLHRKEKRRRRGVGRASKLYPPSRRWGACCIIHHEEERMNTSPTSPLLLAMEHVSYSSTSCPWWRSNGGQGVGCLLHHEEERRITPRLLPTMEYIGYSSSLRWRNATYSRDRGRGEVQRVLHPKEKRRSRRRTPPLLLAMEYASYSSSSM